MRGALSLFPSRHCHRRAEETVWLFRMGRTGEAGAGPAGERARGRGVSRVPPANFLVCYTSFPSLLSLTYSSLFNYFSSEDVFLFFYFYFFSLIKAAFLSPKLYLGGPAGTSAHGHFEPFSLHVCIIANFPQVDGSQVRLREGSEKNILSS